MLKELLSDHQLYMSEFQHDAFVTSNSGGTTLYGQYKQSLRELYKRIRGLREATCDNRKLDCEIRILERNAEKESDELEKELLRIEIIRKKAQQEESERVVKNTEREFRSFYRQSILLKQELTEKHGELTDKIKRKLELEMWHNRMRENVAVDLVCSGRIGKVSYELINAMPPEMSKVILAEVKEHKQLINWYENRKHYNLDPAKLAKIEIKETDIKQLLE